MTNTQKQEMARIHDEYWAHRAAEYDQIAKAQAEADEMDANLCPKCRQPGTWDSDAREMFCWHCDGGEGDLEPEIPREVESYR